MTSQVLENFVVEKELYFINNSQFSNFNFKVNFGEGMIITFRALPSAKSLVNYLYDKDRLKECKILVELKSFTDRNTNKLVNYLDYKLYNNKDISISLTFAQCDKDLYKFFVKDYIKQFKVD